MPPLDQLPTPPPGGKAAPPPRSEPIPVKLPIPPHVGHPVVQKKKGGVGPTVGALIIVILLIFGGLYFWGAYLNNRNAAETLPLIPGDSAQ